jgi:GcrA cell cycle regulator
MHGMLESTWTAAREQELLRMIGQKYSAAQAAAELGDVTRNAVIGKAKRMGARFNSAHPQNSNSTERPLGRRMRRAERVRSEPIARLTRAVCAKLPPMAPEPFALRLPLVPDYPGGPEVANNGCRAPVMSEPPHLFCGQPQQEGSSYCAYHHHRFWHAPRSQVRDPRPR